MSRASMSLAALCLLGAGALTATALATFDNPGFESGDFTGWGVDRGDFGDCTVSASIEGTAAAEGGSCAVLMSGLQDQDSRVWQTVAAAKGDVLSGYGAFTTYDSPPFDDLGQIAVLSGDDTGSDVAVVFEASAGSVGGAGTTGWVPWSFEVPADGTYTLVARVHNVLDSGVSSFLGIDGISVEAAPEPEPGPGPEPVPEPGVIQVSIDVRPGDTANCLNLKSRGVVPVVLFGTADFDVSAVDVGTLAFGPKGAAEKHGKAHTEDVDGDGRPDLVLHFDIRAAGFAAGDTTAILIGMLIDGSAIEGEDTICTK